MISIEPVLDRLGVEYKPDRNGNQQTRCPFHGPDLHASASVNLEKGLFRCFTCSVAGDAIELLMTQEGLDFVEAKSIAEGLAGEAGGSVPREPDPGGSFLPRKSGLKPGGRQWKSPWSGS